MNRNQKAACYMSLAAFFVLALAVTTPADVAGVDQIDAVEMHPMTFSAVNTTLSLEGSRLRTGITESGCVGVYSARQDTVVFHSVCQDANAGDNERTLADLAQNRAFMFSNTPQRFVAFNGGRLPQSSFNSYGAGEAELAGTRWKFDVLDRIAASQAAIEAATALLPGARSTDETGIGHHDKLQGEDADHDSGRHGEDKDHDDDDRDPPVVPEPATLLLLGMGICVLGLLRRRLTTA